MKHSLYTLTVMAGLVSYFSVVIYERTVGHNMNGKHISVPKRLIHVGAYRWESKQFLLRSVLPANKLIYKRKVHLIYIILCYIILHYITYHPQLNLLHLFKPNKYKHHMFGKEMSKEPNSCWICQETIGKAKCHGRTENWLLLGD